MLEKLKRYGMSRESVLLVAKDNEVDIDNPLAFKAFLEAIGRQVFGDDLEDGTKSRRDARGRQPRAGPFLNVTISAWGLFLLLWIVDFFVPERSVSVYLNHGLMVAAALALLPGLSAFLVALTRPDDGRTRLGLWLSTFLAVLLLLAAIFAVEPQKVGYDPLGYFRDTPNEQSEAGSPESSP